MNDFIGKYNWYERSVRQRLSPFPSVISMEAICNEMQSTIGFAYSQVLLVCQKDVLTTYFDKNDENETEKKAMEWLERKPAIFQDFSEKILEIGRPFMGRLELLTVKKVQNLSVSELANWFGYFEKNYRKIYCFYDPIIVVENILEKKLRSIIELHESDSQKRPELFALLTFNPWAMVNQTKDIALIPIIEKINKNPDWVDMFRLDSSELMLKIQKNSGLFQLIEQYRKEYFWITRDYEDPITTIENVIVQIKVNIENLSLLKSKKRDAENQPFVLRELQQKLGLSESEIQLFQAMRDGVFLKETKKEVISKALYYFDFILSEVSRRTGIAIAQLRFMKMSEVSAVLSKPEMYRQVLSDRSDLSVWLVKRDVETDVMVGSRASKVQNNLSESCDYDLTELIGQPISGGTVRGPVRLMLNPDDGKYVEDGDVIVTIQAVPAFSPAIGRASALLADGGTGLTSHTATLAREAKIPAIGRLKIACKLLKNGDIVEVNGDTGKVKILKKKKF